MAGGSFLALNAAAATGAGSWQHFTTPQSMFAVQPIITGAPSAAIITLEGSLDGGTTAFILGTWDLATLASGAMIFPSGMPVTSVRANLTTLTAGTDPTVTVRVAHDSGGGGTLNTTLAGDIALGAVEIKNATTDTRAAVIADNAAFVDGTSAGLVPLLIYDEVAGTALTENDAAAARIDVKRAQVMVLEDATTRGIANRQSVLAASTPAAATDKPAVVALHPSSPLPSSSYSAAVSFTRPATTPTYSANDVVGATAAALEFTTMGPSAGRIMITSASYEADVAAIPAGMTSFLLHLYNVTPPSAFADDAAFDLPSGDRASYLGFISLGSPTDLGSTLYVEANGINKQVKLAGTSLFGYLVTVGSFLATISVVKKVTLHAVGL